MPSFPSQKQKTPEAWRLKRLREHLNLSQRELALEFKVAPSAIANWENHERTIPGSVLKLLELYEEEFGLYSAPHEMEKGSSPPVSRLARTINLSSTATGMMGSCLKQIFISSISSDRSLAKYKREIYLAMARKLANRLAEMRGLGIKAIQTLNYYDFALPPEAQKVFASFQAVSKPMPQKKVARVFAEEFGQTPKKIFSAWSAVPIATASIGQVHLAELPGGERVAVKVQYPKIAKTVRADLQNLAFLSRGISFLMRGQDWQSTLQELGERFAEECDYQQEANHQEEFGRIYLGRSDLLIPKVHRKFSTQRIMVSEYIAGKNFSEFCQTASQDERDRAGATIWKFGFESVLRHGLLHADPHPGNFLFAEGRVAFLDFGCVKRFKPEFIRSWKRMIQAIHLGDRAAFKNLTIEMGMAPRPNRFDFDHFFESSSYLYSPFTRDESYAFSKDYREKAWSALFVNTPNRAEQCVPKDWIFLTRLSWGLAAVLTNMGAITNWRKIGLPLIYET